jgi:hypothetical protein
MKYKIEIHGTMPLMMRSDILADPLHPSTKALKQISGKRSKTDEDHQEMARMEFIASLYRGHNDEIVIPSNNLMACLIEGARVSRSGPKVERGVTMMGIEFPLEYVGPRNPEDLYADASFVDRRSVKVSTKIRIMRVRPVFREWGFTAEAYADPTVCSEDDLAAIASTAGNLIGLGDNRKGGYGRFTSVVTKI